MVLLELYIKKSILFLLLTFTTLNLNSQCIIPHPFDYLYSNDILKITQRQRRGGKSVKIYNNGFLKKEIFYDTNHKIRSTTFYEYDISDTLWVVYHKNTLSKKAHKEYLSFIKDTCVKITYCNNQITSDSVLFINHIPVLKNNDTSLGTVNYSFTADTLYEKFHTRNGEIASITKAVYKYGKLVYMDKEILNDPLATIADVVPWSSGQRNKYVISYEKFDKKKNWTKCYYITSTGRVLYYTRKIKYQK